MKCANCGAEVREGVRFCTECGRPMAAIRQNSKAAAPKREAPAAPAGPSGPAEAMPPMPERAAKAPKEKKPKKKVKWGLIIFLTVLVALLALAAYAWFSFPSFKMMRALNKGTAESYAEAAEFYDDVADSGLQTKLAEMTCKSKISKPADDYKAGKLSFEDAEEFYAALAEDEDDNALSKKAVEILAEIRAQHEIEENLAKGDEAFDNGDYEAAMDYYSKIPKDSEEYKKAQDKINESHEKYVDNVIDKVDSLVKKGSYADAIKALETALTVLPDDAVLQDKQDAVTTEYETVTLQKADEYVEANKYDAAIALLEDALKVLPDSDKLVDKLDEISDSKPTKLKDVKVIDSKNYKLITESFNDSFGNTFDGAHYFGEYEAYSFFNLDRKFSRFTGSIVCMDSAPSNANYLVKIYGDGELLYTSDSLTKTTGEVSFDVDVSGITKLEIRVEYERGYNACAIVNALLKP